MSNNKEISVKEILNKSRYFILMNEGDTATENVILGLVSDITGLDEKDIIEFWGVEIGED